MASLFGGDRNKSPFFNEDWVSRRQADKANEDWYSSKALEELADPTLPYILGINPIAKVCRVHRGVFIGILPKDYDGMPINIVFGSNKEQIAHPDYLQIQTTLNGIHEDSNHASLLVKAGRDMQVVGGYAFKVNYDPTNDRLRYGIQVIGLTQSMIDPTPNPVDPWDLISCRVGYLISKDDAETIYHIKSKSSENDVVYLEEWDKKKVVVTVDGQRIEDKCIDHNIGRVPIIYIPHERGKYWGTSRVPELIGLCREKNERAMDMGDKIYSDTHAGKWGVNIKNAEIKPILGEDKLVVDRYVDIGRGTPGMAGVDPRMETFANTTLSESAAKFESSIWDEICRQGDVAKVSLGEEDASSGRTTGPGVANRMLMTMNATQNDRVEYTTGLREINSIILRILMQNAKELKAAGKDIPTVTVEHLKVRPTAEWPEQIPIEVTDKNTMLVSRLQASGISILDFLKDIGVHDYQSAAERIWADRERQAEIEARVKLKVAEMQAETQQEIAAKRDVVKPQSQSAPTI